MQGEKLKPTPARIRVERVGSERLPVLVIERLFTNPEPLLHTARRAVYGAPKAQNFPGLRAPAPAAYIRLLGETLSPLLRRTFDLQGCDIVAASSDFSLITQAPETLTLRQRIPHRDGDEPGLLALLHYLTPGGCFGTSFYRHRATGFEHVNRERRVEYQRLLSSELMANIPQGYTTGDGPIFERTRSFEGAFNRLLVYQGYTLHSGDVPPDFAFSSDPNRGRLTANTFLTMRPPS